MPKEPEHPPEEGRCPHRCLSFHTFVSACLALMAYVVVYRCVHVSCACLYVVLVVYSCFLYKTVLAKESQREVAQHFWFKARKMLQSMKGHPRKPVYHSLKQLPLSPGWWGYLKRSHVGLKSCRQVWSASSKTLTCHYRMNVYIVCNHEMPCSKIYFVMQKMLSILSPTKLCTQLFANSEAS